MTKAEKLLQKIRNNPKQVSFEDLDTLLRRFGFERDQSGGGTSHFGYFHQRLPKEKLVVPYRRPHLHSIYVNRALDLIEALQRFERKD